MRVFQVLGQNGLELAHRLVVFLDELRQSGDVSTDRASRDGRGWLRIAGDRVQAVVAAGLFGDLRDLDTHQLRLLTDVESSY